MALHNAAVYLLTYMYFQMLLAVFLNFKSYDHDEN